jgi:hypothetical protein
MGLNLMVLKKKLNVQKLIVLIICLDSIVYILSLEEDYHTLNLKKEPWWHELSQKKKFNPHQFNIEKEPNTMDSVYEKNTTLKGLALRRA